MKRNYLLVLSLAANILGIVLAGLLVHRLGGWNFFRYRLAQRGISAEYEHRRSLYSVMEPDTNTIVFLGNSLTAYCDWAELLSEPAIRNRGIPGDRINGVLERLDDVERLHPRQIFLMIGINDLLFDDPAGIAEKYSHLVNEIQRKIPAAKLYLKSVLPVNNEVRNTFVNNEDVEAVNEAIIQLAGERSLPFIDLRPVFRDQSGQLDARFTEDGVHLNGPAYQLWAEKVAEFLSR